MTQDIDTSREAVEALMEGVTPEGWRSDGIAVEGPTYGVTVCITHYPATCPGDTPEPLSENCKHNQRFIAASRQLVPALLDRAEKAEAELYAFKLAVAGGEDAPGAAASVTLKDVQRWMAEAARESSELAALKAERDALRGVVRAARNYHDHSKAHFLDGDFDRDGGLAESEAELCVALYALTAGEGGE